MFYFIILLFSYSLIFAAALVIFMIDAKHQIIPDSMLVVMLIGVLPHVRLSYLAVSFCSGLFFYLLWFGTKGRGLGFGDVKLALVMGFLLGHPKALISFYVAFLTGALWGVILMIGGRVGMKSKIAFGPFLIIGMFASIFWGDALWQWWVDML